MNNTLKPYILTAFMAALTAVFSQLIIPIPIIPISLCLVAVYMSAGLLGAFWGAVSQIVYIALGIVGLPVFAGFSSGGAIAGPTGGYIVGYVFCAVVAGLIIGKNANVSYLRICVALLSGLAVCYAFGTAWYCIYAKIGVAEAFVTCVVPYLPADAVKIAVSVFAIKKLRPIVAKIGKKAG